MLKLSQPSQMVELNIRDSVRQAYKVTYGAGQTDFLSFSGQENPTICFSCYSARGQVHAGELRFVHRPARQAPSEPCAEADFGCNWHA